MSWQNLTLTIEGRFVDGLSDALMGAGAVAVDVRDADAGTGAEQPVYGEPQTPAVHWPRCRITALFPAAIDAHAALRTACASAAIEPPADAAATALDDCDWVRLTQSQFKPIRISARLWIVPSWEQPPDPAAINIDLDPGAAFGTGSHATTRLCLSWLDAHLRRGESVLDYGCGSGILAIAAARLGAGRVAGVDIDPQAVLAARANAMQNRVAAEFHSPGAEPKLAYDVVLANILAGPLIALAPLLAAATRPAGRIVMSGVLEAQADEVIAAYASRYRMAAPIIDDGWALLAGERSTT